MAIDSTRKKRVVQKLMPDVGNKKPVYRGGPISVPIAITKDLDPKVVIKKWDPSKLATTASSSYFEDSKKDTFLYKKIQAEDTSSDANSDEYNNSNEKEGFDPSIKLTGKLNLACFFFS